MTLDDDSGHNDNSVDLDQVIADHQIWLKEETRGKRASLTRADLSEVDLNGKDLSRARLPGAQFGGKRLQDVNFTRAVLVGADFKRCRLIDVRFDRAQLVGAKFDEAEFLEPRLENANLFKAELPDVKLERANLEKAQLGDAILENSVLSSAKLIDADLTGANLAKADLRRAELQRARFEGANLHGAKLIRASGLSDANLRHADLSEATGLFGDDLAGRDLTGARLPRDIHDFHTVPIIEENSRNSRNIFLTMLLICAYSWLTMGTTVDYRLVANSASSPLPIIGASIPIASFYWFAPIVLIAIYAYLHIYLLRLWDGLSRLPAVFPDGRRIDQRVYPWLLTGLVRRHVDRHLTDRSAQAQSEELVTIVLAWWTVPITQLGFWWFYLPRHDWIWTSVHVMLFALTVAAATGIYAVASSIMATRGKYALRATGIIPGAGWAIAALLALGASSFAAIHGIPSGQGPAEPWVQASLRDADVSSRPATYWLISDPLLRDESIKGADLEGSDLRFAQAERAFLANANLAGARLEGAKLRHAVLRGANLAGTRIEGAELQGADLTDATGLTQSALDTAHCDEATRLPARPPNLSKDKCMAGGRPGAQSSS